MEIKCKVSFSLPEDLMEALDINDDTPVIASISILRIMKPRTITKMLALDEPTTKGCATP